MRLRLPWEGPRAPPQRGEVSVLDGRSQDRGAWRGPARTPEIPVGGMDAAMQLGSGHLSGTPAGGLPARQEGCHHQVDGERAPARSQDADVRDPGVAMAPRVFLRTRAAGTPEHASLWAAATPHGARRRWHRVGGSRVEGPGVGSAQGREGPWGRGHRRGLMMGVWVRRRFQELPIS